MLNSPSPPHCIFCQKVGPLTKEHAIPGWLAALQPSDVKVAAEGGQREVRDWKYTTDKVELLTRCVCAACNNGWMSSLEDSCKPLLTELYHGVEVSLSPREQHQVSAWATKTVMVMETLGASTRNPHFTADERRRFAEALEMPEGQVSFSLGMSGDTHSGVLSSPCCSRTGIASIRGTPPLWRLAVR